MDQVLISIKFLQSKFYIQYFFRLSNVGVPPVLKFSSINMRKPIINLSIIQINVASTTGMLDNSNVSPIKHLSF